MREKNQRSKRSSLKRAGLLTAFTTVFLAAGYGLAVFGLTQHAGAGIAVGTSAPSSIPLTTFTTTVKSVHNGTKCSGHGRCASAPDTAADNVFLCYSKFQTAPGIWPESDAADLLDQGYWLPVAVPGNVDGGSDIGAYHLVCNATGSPTGKVVNANGEVSEGSPGAGYYPVIA